MAQFDLLKKVYGYIAIQYDREEAVARDRSIKDSLITEESISPQKRTKADFSYSEDEYDALGFPKNVDERFSDTEEKQSATTGFPSREPDFLQQADQDTWSDEFIYLETLIETVKNEAKEKYALDIPIPESSFGSMTGARYKHLTDILTKEEKENPWPLEKIESFLKNYPSLLETEIKSQNSTFEQIPQESSVEKNIEEEL